MGKCQRDRAFCVDTVDPKPLWECQADIPVKVEFARCLVGHSKGQPVSQRARGSPKILPHISKQQIFKSNKPAKIYFEAKWLSKDNKPLKKIIQHFKNNIDEIVRGIAE